MEPWVPFLLDVCPFPVTTLFHTNINIDQGERFKRNFDCGDYYRIYNNFKLDLERDKVTMDVRFKWLCLTEV